MDQMHSLLKRQLKRYFGTADSIPSQWQDFVEAVNDAYRQSDDDRNMLERSLELSSQELLQANSELRTIFEAFPDLFFRLDHEGAILEYKAGRTAESYIPMENLIGKRVQDVPFEDVGHKFMEAIHQLRQSKSMVSIEYTLEIQGQENHYEARLLPVLEDQVIAIVRNITEQKHAEEALRESETRYRTTVETSPEVIFSISPELGTITSLNPAFSKITGWQRKDWLGSPFISIIHADDIPIAMEKYEQVLNGETTQAFQLRILSKAGEYLVGEFVGTPKIEDGKVVNIFGFAHDITDRLRAVDALRESEARLRQVIDLVPHFIFARDRRGRFILVNRAVAEAYRTTVEELTGKTDADFNPNSDEVDKFLQDDLEVMDSGMPKKIPEEIITDSEGNIRVLQTTKIPFTLPKTKDDLVLGVAIDITEVKQAEKERMRLEAQLRHAQKMESIGTLTSGVAHNFRNILTGILANSQLLQLLYRQDPKLVEIEQRTESAVQRGAQLVKDLMQLSRKERQSIFEQVNLAQVLNETYELIGESFDKKIDIHIDVPETIPMKGNPASLSQVIMNLCTNARDAMPLGGKLVINARREGDKALVIVSDTGHGMDNEIVEKCFDPFFTTKDVDKGTGLGLSTAYGIVKDHGGDIHAYSEPGKGTIFKLYFPVAVSEEEGNGKVAVKPVRGIGQKVLIVDDEMEMLKSMENMLESLGYRVESVTSGEEAVLKYQSWRPDVVLLDRNMPEMDGITCARKVIEAEPEAKIVLISGYEETGPTGIDDKTKAIIKGYLSKPINIQDLASQLARVIND